MSVWPEIRKSVLERIKPTRAEEITLKEVGGQVVDKINAILKKSGIQGVAEIHGSVPHGTWVTGQMDLDIFVVLDTYRERGQLNEVLDALREHTDWEFTEAWAEHPYLQTEIGGYNLDIVPCFRARIGDRIRSATDRSPLHTVWLKGRLNGLGDDVRLLKQFLKVTGIYGAEIKIGGFSGYLCELLIIKHGSFMELMESASNWGDKEVLRFKDETREFNDPLVVYDPVDSLRNVASALREEPYRRFISAARAFKESPIERFFTFDETPVDTDELLERIGESSLVFVIIEENKAEVPDTLWGQLRRSVGAIEKQLALKGFDVIRSTVWSNEETRHVLAYMLGSINRTETDKHFGPPVGMEKDVERFLGIYTDNPRVVSGPEIEDGRWFVVLYRHHTHVTDTMDELLSDGGARIGVSRRTAVRILQHHRVIVGEGIGPYLNGGFERHLAEFIRGRPFWVE